MGIEALRDRVTLPRSRDSNPGGNQGAVEGHGIRPFVSIHFTQGTMTAFQCRNAGAGAPDPERLRACLPLHSFIVSDSPELSLQARRCTGVMLEADSPFRIHSLQSLYYRCGGLGAGGSRPGGPRRHCLLWNRWSQANFLTDKPPKLEEPAVSGGLN